MRSSTARKGTDDEEEQAQQESRSLGILREREAGAATADVYRRHGISSATFYNCNAQLGGMDVSDAKRLEALEVENSAKTTRRARSRLH